MAKRPSALAEVRAALRAVGVRIVHTEFNPRPATYWLDGGPFQASAYGSGEYKNVTGDRVRGINGLWDAERKTAKTLERNFV
jgi:hypothetical protein